MKINEVEALVGISKKNIRFYEEQGLLKPERNGENGYRVYSQADVDTLQRIKLMRKIGVSLEEIRAMQTGIHTVGDAMRRHMISLERDKENLERSMDLCRELQSRKERLDQFPAETVLEQMAQMEADGVRFSDRQDRDVRKRYTAPIIAAVCMVAIIAVVVAVLVWAIATDPAEAPPWPILAVLFAIPVCVCIGVVHALLQRIQEINKGEIDDAKQY